MRIVACVADRSADGVAQGPPLPGANPAVLQTHSTTLPYSTLHQRARVETAAFVSVAAGVALGALVLLGRLAVRPALDHGPGMSGGSRWPEFNLYD